MIAVPGLTPTSPVIIDAPVLVTVVAPRTAKPCAVPRGDWADAEEAVSSIALRRTIAEP